MEQHRRQIRRAEWGPFMERFSDAHRGWRVRVGVIDTCLMRSSMETAARPVADDALFEGLRLDARADGDHLAVLLGLANVMTTHAVASPRRVYVETAHGGAEEALRVDAADGTTLLLQFAAMGTGEPGRAAPGA